MVAGSLKLFIQSLANRAGYQIRRLDLGVALDDALSEQRRLLGPSVRTIFEVGAADGRDAAQYAAWYPEADVYAFEPVPESFESLMKFAEGHPRLQGFQCALSNSKGHARLNLGAWLDASSLLKARDTGSTFDAYQASSRAIDVTTETIDDFCRCRDISHVDLLKMDTQGAELLVLEGAERMLETGSIDIIYTEMQFAELYEGAALADQIIGKLRGHGYRLHNLYDPHHNQRGELCWSDAIFVRRAAERG
jgi:FkbM family methyltransferase